MKNNRFDEYQLKNRYKAYVQSFWILIVLIVGNEYLIQHYVWAESSIQMLTIVYGTLTYLCVATSLKGAYIGMDVVDPLLASCSYIFLSVISFGVVIERVLREKIDFIVKDGMFTATWPQVMLSSLAGLIGVINLINYMKNKKQVRREGEHEK